MFQLFSKQTLHAIFRIRRWSVCYGDWEGGGGEWWPGREFWAGVVRLNNGSDLTSELIINFFLLLRIKYRSFINYVFVEALKKKKLHLEVEVEVEGIAKCKCQTADLLNTCKYAHSQKLSMDEMNAGVRPPPPHTHTTFEYICNLFYYFITNKD